VAARHFWFGLAGTLAAGCTIGIVASPQLADVSPDLIREKAIAYFDRQATDPAGALSRRLRAGEIKLRVDEKFSYLPAILEALHVPVESQILTYGRNSIQALQINPRNPRAIYFNDSVTVGYIHGADFIEIASQDPQQGIVFYTMYQPRTDAPLERADYCLQCHNSRATLEVPGVLVRSIVTAPNGTPMPRFGNYVSDHRSPFEERWAGWYVTGTHGSMRHLGNTQLVDREHPDAMVSDASLNVLSVQDRFDADRYLSPHSDIAALLVFEHEMRAMNLLTRIGWDARVATAAGRGDVPAIMDAEARDVVDYLLFVDEVPLPSPVKGTSKFAEMFAAQGPRDTRGRSLRQLDLEHRIMRYPCSFMVYSPAFEGLPQPARDAIYRRLWQVLSGGDAAAKYARLSPADRKAILEILRDTKPDLPAFFTS
jgi:hypothetical protein